jgi:hypothetical protein
LTNEPRTISAFIEWIELKTPASYNSPTESSNKKKKKKYRVTPYPHSHSRQKRSRRHSTKKGGKKTKRMQKY